MFRILFFYLLFSICFMMVINETKGQNYIPMLSDSLYWDVAYADMNVIICTEYGNPGSGPYRYAIDGDTIINGTAYKKFKSYLHYSLQTQPSPNCPPFAVDTNLATNFMTQLFFMREDTAAQKVYLYDANYSQEYLWYDFDVQVGDSLYYQLAGDFVVDTIYTVTTMDGINRRYIGCSTSTHPLCGWYIEGLGGTAGIFHEPYTVFESGPWLMCVRDLNQNTIFSSGFVFQCADFTLGTPSLSEELNEMIIYPNPVTDILHINGLKQNQVIVLINTLGEKITVGKTQGNNSISVRHLPLGVYFACALQNNILSPVGKFVKQ